MPQEKKKFFTKRFKSHQKHAYDRPELEGPWKHDKFADPSRITATEQGFTTNKANKASILSRLGGNSKSQKVISNTSSNQQKVIKNNRNKSQHVDKSLTVMIQPAHGPVSSLTSQLSERVSEGIVSDRLYSDTHDDSMAVDQMPTVISNTNVVSASVCTVEVSNLHPDATIDDIRSAFSEFGPVHKVSLRADRHGRSTGVANISFLAKEAAMSAIEMLHNQVADGRVLKVVYVESGISIAGSAQAQARPLAGLVTAAPVAVATPVAASSSSSMYADRLEAVGNGLRPVSRVTQLVAKAALDAAVSTTR